MLAETFGFWTRKLGISIFIILLLFAQTEIWFLHLWINPSSYLATFCVTIPVHIAAVHFYWLGNIIYLRILSEKMTPFNRKIHETNLTCWQVLIHKFPIQEIFSRSSLALNIPFTCMRWNQWSLLKRFPVWPPATGNRSKVQTIPYQLLSNISLPALFVTSMSLVLQMLMKFQNSLILNLLIFKKYFDILASLIP